MLYQIHLKNITQFLGVTGDFLAGSSLRILHSKSVVTSLLTTIN